MPFDQRLLPHQPVTAETERVVVIGGAIEQSETDKAQSVTILNGNNLKQKAAPTLGDTLDTELGIGGSGFTAGASRPVIRGQADNRIRVLNNGTEVFDVSNLSPDHAPSVSTLLSQSIEVVRGPATILFGSGAIGGVVNVTDNVIPVEQPPTALSGEVDGRFDSADLERSGAIALTLSPAKHWVFHTEGSLLRTDDRDIPGFALTREHSGYAHAGTARQQRLRRKSFRHRPEHLRQDEGLSRSAVPMSGTKDTSAPLYPNSWSVYGVPDDPEVDDPTVPPDRVRLDVNKRQVNARSSIVDPFPWFSTVNAKFVYTDYKHDEIDGEEVGATFKTKRRRLTARTRAQADRPFRRLDRRAVLLQGTFRARRRGVPSAEPDYGDRSFRLRGAEAESGAPAIRRAHRASGDSHR